MKKKCLGTLSVWVVLFGLSALSFQTAAMEKKLDTIESVDPKMETKIRSFLDKESKKLSDNCPFVFHLFKDGEKTTNKAGMRISETAKQFSGLDKFPAEPLSGLFFYYQLYNESQRVPHWHANAVEVGTVLNGEMKVTIWEGVGQRVEFIVSKGGTWMIPQASIHCLENVGTEELDFLVSYNNPNAEDRDFSTAWSALPDTILEKTLGLSAEDISEFKKNPKNRLSLYDPGDVTVTKKLSSPYGASFLTVAPLYEGPLGSLRRVDETNWAANKFMSLQQTILKPGSIREPHWYTGSDAFLFVQKGTAYFNMMDGEGNVYNLILKEGDLVFIPIGAFHTYVNVDDKDLEIYESFTSSSSLIEIGIQDASLNFRAGSLAGALGLNRSIIEKIPKTKERIYIRSL
ncbi:MAG: cupin domain-containing protein [Verrucomicrobia bacterium]|nr:cupin domain-containing protein [Verrucomicrobiota bacterium]